MRVSLYDFSRGGSPDILAMALKRQYLLSPERTERRTAYPSSEWRICCGCLYPSSAGGSYFHHCVKMPIPFSTSCRKALLFLLLSFVMSAFMCLLPTCILYFSIPSATRFGISRCWSLRSSACLSGTRRVQLLASSSTCGQGRRSPIASQISRGMPFNQGSQCGWWSSAWGLSPSGGAMCSVLGGSTSSPGRIC